MKRILSLLLVFMILTLSGNLYAEKKGADLLAQRLDGTEIRGELISVKPNSLLLTESERGGDATVDIVDIEAIRILKKSYAIEVGLTGLFLGGIVGAIIGRSSGSDIGLILSKGEASALGAAIGGVSGTLAGAGIGALIGKDKTIRFAGKSDFEIQEIMEKLHKKARIQNFH